MSNTDLFSCSNPSYITRLIVGRYVQEGRHLKYEVITFTNLQRFGLTLFHAYELLTDCCKFEFWREEDPSQQGVLEGYVGTSFGLQI